MRKVRKLKLWGMCWRSWCWTDPLLQHNCAEFEKVHPVLLSPLFSRINGLSFCKFHSQKNVSSHLTNPLLNSLLKSHLVHSAKKWIWYLWAAERGAGLPHPSSECCTPGNAARDHISLLAGTKHHCLILPIKTLKTFPISCCKDFSPHPVLIHLFTWTQLQNLTFILLFHFF